MCSLLSGVVEIKLNDLPKSFVCETSTVTEMMKDFHETHCHVMDQIVYNQATESCPKSRDHWILLSEFAKTLLHNCRSELHKLRFERKF